MKDWKSKTLVPVRSKLISIKELIKATIEVKNESGYWGNYLEIVKFCPQTRCLRVWLGS